MPQRGHEVDLEVPVQLIAEQVGDDNRPGIERLDRRAQCPLVDLEDANGCRRDVEPALSRGVDKQSRGDPGKQVGPFLISDHVHTGCACGLGDEPGRCCLPVRSRQKDTAVRQIAGQAREQPVIEPVGDAAREGSAAAAAKCAAHVTD